MVEKEGREKKRKKAKNNSFPGPQAHTPALSLSLT
jgi:hypothetical protein